MSDMKRKMFYSKICFFAHIHALILICCYKKI